MQNRLIRLLNNLTTNDLENMLLDLYEFYYNFVALTYANDVEAPHVKILTDRLTEIFLGYKNNLCVAMPPRHSKTSVVTLAFPLWLIFQNPNLNILIVNAEANLSENFGIRLREFIKLYGSVFNVYLSDVKHSSTHIKFEDNKGHLYKGSIRLVGSNGSITGQDADYLILDDIYKGFADITPTLLDKKIDWFKTMIIQRRELDTKLIILHTRWASNDLQGYLQENYETDYNFISFPAIKPDGSPLWAERFSTEFLNKQKEEMGERLFSSIYQQQPLDETGSFFDVNNIIWENEPYRIQDNPPIMSCRSWDLAYSDETKGNINDSTAGALMHRLSDETFIVAGLEFGQYGDGLKNQIKRTAENDGVHIPVLIETGTVGGAAKFLFREYSKYLMGYNCIQSEPVGAKIDRATPLKNAILDGKIRIAIMNDYLRGELIKQLKAFPLGKHDDIIDAIAYGFNWLNKFAGGSTVKVGRIQPRTDILGNKYIPKRRNGELIRRYL